MPRSPLDRLDYLKPWIRQPTAIPKEKEGDKQASEAYKKAVDAYQTITALETLYQKLNGAMMGKVPIIYAAPINEKSAQTEALLEIAIEQRANLLKIYKAGKKSLGEQYQSGFLAEEEFHEDLRRFQRLQREFIASDATICRHRERILRHIQGLISRHGQSKRKARNELALSLSTILTHKSMTLEVEQEMFRADYIGYHECQRHHGDDKTDIWCPILKKWLPANRVQMAYLVPSTLDPQTINTLFRSQNGDAMPWTIGNGILLWEDIKVGLDKHLFSLIPIAKPGQPDGIKLVLINEEARHESADGFRDWDFYDGIELEFRNDQRPERRFCYFHYFFAVLRTLQERKLGWETLRERCRSHGLWVTKGPYLRTDMLRKMVEMLDDEMELPEEIFADGDLDVDVGDAKPLGGREMMDVRDLASALLGIDDVEDEEDNDEWI